MSPERMEHLLSLVVPLIVKKDTNFRKAIPPAQRLMLTLRFLASGDSQISLTYLFRMEKKTVSRIISETSEALYGVLSKMYLNAPKNQKQWKKISEEFQELWQFPHVIGAIDGKHIRIQVPNKSGTLFHNYKGFFSLQLLAVCDAKDNFTFVDVGQYVSNNDCPVLANSNISYAIESDALDVPRAERIEGIEEDVPYYLLGDEIFPLNTWLMKPFPGNLPEAEQIFNYRHSRARLSIENAFGILASRWRIFQRPMIGNVRNIQYWVLSCLCLHNYLRQTENLLYCPHGFVDIQTGDGEIRVGEWRSIKVDHNVLEPLDKLRGGLSKHEARQVRETLKEYFNTTNILLWQVDKVRSVGKVNDEQKFSYCIVFFEENVLHSFLKTHI